MSNIREILTEEIEERGFFLPKRTDLPDLPDDVTTLGGDRVMGLMTKYSAMIAYAATEEAIAKGEAEATKGRYREARSQKWIDLRDDNKKRTVAETEAMLDCDEYLVELQQDRILAENYARMVESLLKGFEQKYQLLSREVTRRGLNAERSLEG